MDKQAFKQRMQNLKSYRENNPGKGYWDWKVEAFQDGGQTGDPEEDIDEAIDELKHEINELKEIQQI